MTEYARYRAAVCDLVAGKERAEIVCKSICGDHIIIELGPAQVISIKRGDDRYVASYEVSECKADG